MYNFRQLYKSGCDTFYKKFGNSYSNPHASVINKIIRRFVFDTPDVKILDLGCGGGEVTLALQSQGYRCIHGLDPYTYKLYKTNTDIDAFTYSFQDIGCGSIELEPYDIIIASFSLHLCPTHLLKLTCIQLALKSNWLIIISPHKNPVIKDDYGWKLYKQFIIDRVHTRIYKTEFSSSNFCGTSFTIRN